MKRYHSLTPQEAFIIEKKGTEKPSSGLFCHLSAPGVFTCKKCDAPLYLSSHKFSSPCGWPSFDDELPGAIEKRQDFDGRRTEIICHSCKGHLGHLFLGEGFTDKETRHCVNSLSLSFIPATTPEGYQRAFFAAGCFWGVQYFMDQLPGVVRTEVGYMGGEVVYPTYKEVCSSQTGHAETVEVVFDPNKTSYREIATCFFEIHDFSQKNGQGPDLGPQYRSAIFFLTLPQKKEAEALISFLKAKGAIVETELIAARPFYPAENEHQYYYQKNGSLPYCHRRVKKF